MEYVRYVGGLFKGCSKCGCCSCCCREGAAPQPIRPHAPPRDEAPPQDEKAAHDGHVPHAVMPKSSYVRYEVPPYVTDQWRARKGELDENETLVLERRPATPERPAGLPPDRRRTPGGRKVNNASAHFAAGGQRTTLTQRELAEVAELSRKIFRLPAKAERRANLNKLFASLPEPPWTRELLKTLWGALLDAGRRIDPERLGQLLLGAVNDPAKQARDLLEALHAFSRSLSPEEVAHVVAALFDANPRAPATHSPARRSVASESTSSERRHRLCEAAIPAAFWRCKDWMEMDHTVDPPTRACVVLVDPAPVVRVLTAWLGGASMSHVERDFLLDGLHAESLACDRSGTSSSPSMDPLLIAFKAFLDDVAKNSGPGAGEDGLKAEADLDRRVGHVAAVLQRLLQRAGHVRGQAVPESVRHEAALMGIPREFTERAMRLALQSMQDMPDTPDMPVRIAQRSASPDGSQAERVERKNSDPGSPGTDPLIPTFNPDSPATFALPNQLPSPTSLFSPVLRAANDRPALSGHSPSGAMSPTAHRSSPSTGEEMGLIQSCTRKTTHVPADRSDDGRERKDAKEAPRRLRNGPSGPGEGKPLSKRTVVTMDPTQRATALDAALEQCVEVSPDIFRTGVSGAMRTLDEKGRAEFFQRLVKRLDGINAATCNAMVTAIVDAVDPAAVPEAIGGLVAACDGPQVDPADLRQILHSIRTNAGRLRPDTLVRVVECLCDTLQAPIMRDELIHELMGAAFWLSSRASCQPAAMVEALTASFDLAEPTVFKGMLDSLLQHWQDADDAALGVDALWDGIGALIKNAGRKDAVGRDKKLAWVSTMTSQHVRALLTGVLHCRWRAPRDLARSLEKIHDQLGDCDMTPDQQREWFLKPALARILDSAQDARYAISNATAAGVGTSPGFSRAIAHEEAGAALATLWRLGSADKRWNDDLMKALVESIPTNSPDRLAMLMYTLAVPVISDKGGKGRLGTFASMLDFIIRVAAKHASALQQHSMMSGYVHAHAQRWREREQKLAKLESAVPQGRAAQSPAGHVEKLKQQLVKEKQDFIFDVLRQLAYAEKGRMPSHRYVAAVHALAQVLREPELFGEPLKRAHADVTLGYTRESLLLVMVAALRGCGLPPQRNGQGDKTVEESVARQLAYDDSPTKSPRVESKQSSSSRQDGMSHPLVLRLAESLSRAGLGERTAQNKPMAAEALYDILTLAEQATLPMLPRPGDGDGLQLAALAYVRPASKGPAKLQAVVARLLTNDDTHQAFAVLNLLRMAAHDREIDLNGGQFSGIHQRLLLSVKDQLAPESDSPREAVETLGSFYSGLLASAGLGFAMREQGEDRAISMVQATRHKAQIGDAAHLVSVALDDIDEVFESELAKSRAHGAMAYLVQTVEKAQGALPKRVEEASTPDVRSGRVREVETKQSATHVTTTTISAPPLTVEEGDDGGLNDEDERSLRFDNGGDDFTESELPDTKVKVVNMRNQRSNAPGSTAALVMDGRTIRTEGPVLPFPTVPTVLRDAARSTTTSSSSSASLPTDRDLTSEAPGVDSAFDNAFNALGTYLTSATDYAPDVNKVRPMLDKVLGDEPSDEVCARVCGLINAHAEKRHAPFVKVIVSEALKKMGGRQMSSERLKLIIRSLLGDNGTKGKTMGQALGEVFAPTDVAHLGSVINTLKEPSRVPVESRVAFGEECLRRANSGAARKELDKHLPKGHGLSLGRRLQIALGVPVAATPETQKKPDPKK